MPIARMRKEAGKLEAVADKYGWEIKSTLRSEDTAKLFVVATRGQEEIKIHWEEGRLLVAPVYTLAGRVTKLRNASACVQQMAQKPDFSKVARVKRAAMRRSEVSVIEILPDPSTLPWYGEEVTDKDILRACYSKQITWRNSITGLPEVDRVVRSPNPDALVGNFNKINYHITKGSGGRLVINFLGMFGYRSVAVNEILRVG